MSRVEGSIRIDVSPEAIKAALEDVAHAAEWSSSLVKVWDIQGQGAGCTYKWTYKMGPATFDGRTEIVESTPERFVMNTIGGIASTWTWTWMKTPLKGGCVLKIVVEFKSQVRRIEKAR
jgi:carbon monoxide dehydrogenase subunit G